MMQKKIPVKKLMFCYHTVFIDSLVQLKMKLLAHVLCYFAILLMFNGTYCQQSQLETLRPIYRFFRGLAFNLLKNRDENDAYQANLEAGVSYYFD